MNIFILGGGTWGTALASVLAKNNCSVCVWVRNKEKAEVLRINRKHDNLPGLVIPDIVEFTSDLNRVASADFVLFAVPSIHIRSTAEKVSNYVLPTQIIVNVAKGIEKDTLFLMSEVLNSIFLENSIVTLSGPTHAEEVALGLPTTIVSASNDSEAAEATAKLLEGTCIRAYTNSDVFGVEICGALKNIIALAAGISDGLGYGDNAKAAIITRGIAEIRRLGLAMGCVERTFAGLAGIGDLVVTATSCHSRNNRCGYLIGRGYRVDDAVKEVGMVVEGLNSIRQASQLAEKYHVRMPIVNAIRDIAEGKSASEVAEQFINNPDRMVIHE